MHHNLRAQIRSGIASLDKQALDHSKGLGKNSKIYLDDTLGMVIKLDTNRDLLQQVEWLDTISS